MSLFTTDLLETASEYHNSLLYIISSVSKADKFAITFGTTVIFLFNYALAAANPCLFILLI